MDPELGKWIDRSCRLLLGSVCSVVEGSVELIDPVKNLDTDWCRGSIPGAWISRLE